MSSPEIKKIDWILVGCYLVLVLFGWLNVFSSSLGDEGFVWSLSSKYVMHLIWIATSVLIALLILFVIPERTYSGVAWPFYVLMVFLLVAVAFVGVEVNGSKSWFALGPVRIQPAEFSKIATALILAHVMGKFDFSFENKRDFLFACLLLIIPMLAILMEKETGSMLVYVGFLLMFYREGMTPWILVLGILAILIFILTLVLTPYISVLILIGIVAAISAIYAKKPYVPILAGALTILAFSFFPKLMGMESLKFLSKLTVFQWTAALTSLAAIIFALVGFLKRKPVLRNAMLGYLLGICLIFSVQFVFDNILQDHQRARIEVLLGIKEDPMGVGYNVHQSLVAIGSGGLAGKGFLGGTQTRFDFVPEQSTDFIFCTIGEEWGYIGSLFVLILYLVMIVRILNLAEKQRDSFHRIYGYCVACCLLMHVVINICMTIGLMPVIGIPLPMLSYGGSSLWAFTILIFIFLRFDMERRK